MELNLAQEGWIDIFACPKQCFLLSEGTRKQCFFKGGPQSTLVMPENLMANCPSPGQVLEGCVWRSGGLLSSLGS